MRRELVKEIERLVDQGVDHGSEAVVGNLSKHANAVPDLIGELALFNLRGNWVPEIEIEIQVDPKSPKVPGGFLEVWAAGEDGGHFGVWGWRKHDDVLDAPVVFAGSDGDLFMVATSLRAFLALSAIGEFVFELPGKSKREIAKLVAAPTERVKKFRAWLADAAGIEVDRDPQATIRSMIPSFIAFDKEHRRHPWYAPLEKSPKRQVKQKRR
jgi:hypothetical protein